MIWNNYGQHSQETLPMVPHATGNLFVPPNEKARPNLWWIHTSSMWKLTLEMVLSLASQFTIKPLAKTWPTWMLRKRQKSDTKTVCLINHFRLFRRHLGASGHVFYWNVFLNFGLRGLGLGLWYRSFPTPRGPGYLFTANKVIHAHDVTF